MTKNLAKFYEDLMDDLSMDTDQRYLEYVKQKDGSVVIDNLVFDTEYLDVYYKCEGCRRRNHKAFCCNGYDVELTAHDVEVVEKHLSEVVKMFPKLDKVLEADYFWGYGDDFERVLSRKDNEDCVFLLPGSKGCMLHAYALENGLDPIDVKPYICSLYPVVVIVIGDEIVVTTFNEESRVVLETGDAAVPCAASSGADEDHALRRTREILSRMLGQKNMAKAEKSILGGD